MAVANTYASLQSLYKESYSDGKKKKRFQRLKKYCSDAKKKQS